LQEALNVGSMEKVTFAEQSAEAFRHRIARAPRQHAAMIRRIQTIMPSGSLPRESSPVQGLQ
jgi:hypothetical protein